MPETTSGSLISQDGKNTLAWEQQKGDTSRAGILFLHGYRSDKGGTKAEHIARLCTEHAITLTRFDLRGHGESSGHYSAFTIGDWVNDTCQILDTLTTGDQIVIGSSLGGWLALRLAELRPHRVKGLIGCAAAPDFPTELILPSLTPAQRIRYEQEGVIVDEESAWPEKDRFTRAFMEESVQHTIFQRPYRFEGTVALLQGKKDTSVPWQIAHRLAAHIDAPEVHLTLINDGDHRLTRDSDLALLSEAVNNLIRHRN